MGAVINAVVIAWAIFIAIVFMLPPNELVLCIMIGVAVFLAAYWFLSARRHFVGALDVAPPPSVAFR
jgi:hypothetical protein